MILVDTNVLMYAAGSNHPNQASCINFLNLVSDKDVDAVLDSEVLQEILHRYRSIGRWALGCEIFDLAITVFDEILPITRQDVVWARQVMSRDEGISARDAIHIAVAETHGMDAICTFDRGFEDISTISRREPKEFI